MSSLNRNKNKSRFWFGVIYPDSVPDWKSRLDNSLLDLCYIVHDKDKIVDLEEEERHQGDERKTHVHVIIAWTAPTTKQCIKDLGISLGFANGYVEAIDNIKNYYDYLIHKNKPNKFQYDRSERIEINNFDIGEYIQISKHDTYLIKNDIIDFINDNHIIFFYQLTNSIYTCGDIKVISVYDANYRFFEDYVKSYGFRHSKKGQELASVNYEIEYKDYDNYDPNKVLDEIKKEDL